MHSVVGQALHLSHYPQADKQTTMAPERATRGFRAWDAARSSSRAKWFSHTDSDLCEWGSCFFVSFFPGTGTTQEFTLIEALVQAEV